MITKAELDKMVDERAEMFTAHILNDGNWISIQKDCNSDILESAYIAGGKCVTGILMPEIERVENNCDTLENKAIFWMETNDRAIEHTESLQLTITTLKTEIQSLKDERDNAIKAMDYHINSDMRTQEENQSLKDENEELKSRVEIGLYNLELRTKENKSIIDNQDETKWAYWRKRAGEMTDAWIDQKDLALTLTAKAKRYEEALKFYANENNEYEGVIGTPESPELWEENPIDEYSRRQYRHLAWWKYDRGEVARAALNQGEEREFFEMQNAKGKFEK